MLLAEGLQDDPLELTEVMLGILQDEEAESTLRLPSDHSVGGPATASTAPALPFRAPAQIPSMSHSVEDAPAVPSRRSLARHTQPSRQEQVEDGREEFEEVELPGRLEAYTSMEAAVLMSLLPHEKWGWHYIRDGENGVGDAECRVCLDEYVAGAEIVRLPCMHFAHTRCMEEWLLRCPVCPVCRTNAREAISAAGM